MLLLLGMLSIAVIYVYVCVCLFDTWTLNNTIIINWFIINGLMLLIVLGCARMFVFMALFCDRWHTECVVDVVVYFITLYTTVVVAVAVLVVVAITSTVDCIHINFFSFCPMHLGSSSTFSSVVFNNCY